MIRRGHFRASDLDREQVAERLRRAAAEGRLLPHELEARLARALRAQTYGELDALVSDLPLPVAPRPPAQPFPIVRLALTVALAVLFAPMFVVLATAAMFMFGGWFLAAILGFLVFNSGRRAGRRHFSRGRDPLGPSPSPFVPLGRHFARGYPGPRRGFL